MIKNYYVYILTNKYRGTLYIGVTNNIARRFEEHKDFKSKNSFVTKYFLNKLVYFEIYHSIEDAITREKQLKNWKRDWKIKLIEDVNKEWKDFGDELF